MLPLEFPEQTTKLAKSQPQFRPLPVFVQRLLPDTQQEHLQFTFKYGLTDLEIEQIIKTKSLWFSQFGSCFHPVFAQVETPFGVCNVTYQKNDDNTYNFWIPMLDGRIEVLNNIPIDLAMVEVMSWANLKAEQILFIEKPSMSVDENGNLKAI